MSVYSNNDKKGNFLVPVVDPDFLVTIGETTNAIVIKNDGDGTLHVSNVTANMRISNIDFDNEFRRPHQDFSYDTGLFPEIDGLFEENKATSLARAAQLIVGHMRHYSDLESEFVPYLLPVKTASAKVRYIASAQGVLGADVRPALRNMVVQMIAAKPVTDSMLRTDHTFEITIRFLALKEKIKDLID